ncbi:hypothetical protein SCB29_38250, partial [Paraburkholderia sp. SIMBA_055]
TTAKLNSMIEKATNGPLSECGHLSREEFASNHGANLNDLKKVEEFVKKQGLEVKDINITAGTVILAGTGHVHVPEELADIVEALNR